MEHAMVRSKWFLPGFAGFLAIVVFVALWVGGDATEGVYAASVLVAFGLFVLVGGVRSETIRGLRGDGKDERFERMDIAATALSGVVLISVVIVAWIVEVTRGHSGDPYGWLGAVAGLSYIAAIVFMRFRG
jgi:cobalamin synthase